MSLTKVERTTNNSKTKLSKKEPKSDLDKYNRNYEIITPEEAFDISRYQECEYCREWIRNAFQNDRLVVINLLSRDVMGVVDKYPAFE